LLGWTGYLDVDNLYKIRTTYTVVGTTRFVSFPYVANQVAYYGTMNFTA
jgi:hypothetical protein